eukprot:CAMPEP_0170451168 /NCGR_PEP_ID=MMETSP0123-20130129/497_1 /TAXON_ID=182087 /ORGANISM="Favella ehrenbergii, Strain Fehren 1" /LENGTH=155 /DNA_ID=CAMNT_0010712765 /DNA_START=420 /DNA_END=888 /DNA_ORIENTATION=+
MIMLKANEQGRLQKRILSQVSQWVDFQADVALQIRQPKPKRPMIELLKARKKTKSFTPNLPLPSNTNWDTGVGLSTCPSYQASTLENPFRVSLTESERFSRLPGELQAEERQDFTSSSSIQSLYQERVPGLKTIAMPDHSIRAAVLILTKSLQVA